MPPANARVASGYYCGTSRKDWAAESLANLQKWAFRARKDSNPSSLPRLEKATGIRNRGCALVAATAAMRRRRRPDTCWNRFAADVKFEARTGLCP